MKKCPVVGFCFLYVCLFFSCVSLFLLCVFFALCFFPMDGDCWEPEVSTLTSDHLGFAVKRPAARITDNAASSDSTIRAKYAQLRGRKPFFSCSAPLLVPFPSCLRLSRRGAVVSKKKFGGLQVSFPEAVSISLADLASIGLLRVVLPCRGLWA